MYGSRSYMVDNKVTKDIDIGKGKALNMHSID